MPKVRWKHERGWSWRWNHCVWSLLKVMRTCPIWQPEKMVEKLNRSSCLVKFCWFGIIAQASRVEFMQLSRRALNPSFWWAVWYILLSFNGHFWTFDTQNTATDWSCNIWFEQISHSQSVAYSPRLILLYLFFKKTECDFENFIVAIKCKNYLEKRLLHILLHNILLSSLELSRRGRLARYKHRGTQSAVVLLSFAFFPRVRGKEMVNPQMKLWKVFFT